MAEDNPQEKSQKIQRMFNSISHRYDLLNYLLSFGRDRSWRKRAVRLLSPHPGSRVLDLACGTGDVSLTIARLFPETGSLLGMDFSENMLSLARKKFDDRQVRVPYEFQFGDATDLPLEDESVDCVTIAFGIRNVVDVPKALQEIERVLKPAGRLMILEFSPPTGKVFGPLFHFYFKKVLPTVGGWISGQKQAYSYLPESVTAFYSVDELCELMSAAGMEMRAVKKYTFGVTVAYLAEKTSGKEN